MTPATECNPFPVCKAPSASWTRRLLAIMPRLARRRLPSVNPEELPPHRLRDLGLADDGFRGGQDGTSLVARGSWFR